IVAARVGNLAVIAVALLVLAFRGGGLGPRLSGWTLIGLALLSGTLDAGANVLYFLAAHGGMLSLAAVLTSLYPAITVLLARIAYTERLRAVQQVGMAVAVAGVALVTVGCPGRTTKGRDIVATLGVWRWWWDSNPRKVALHTLSRRAPSSTRRHHRGRAYPTLRSAKN